MVPLPYKIISLCQYVDICWLEACSITHCKRSEGTYYITDKFVIVTYMIGIYTTHYDKS